MSDGNIRRAPRTGLIPPWMLAVGAMLSMQLAAAFSVSLIDRVGSSGAAWLRLTMGAVILLVIARPPLRSIRRADWPVIIALGVATAVMQIAFLAALQFIPLGTAVAIEFLGPLTVAAIRSRSPKMLAWPILALIGVVLLTEPWHGEIHGVGIALAGASGVGWGLYIVLTQKVAYRYDGISILSLTIPLAAIIAAFMGIPQAAGHLNMSVLGMALGIAFLAPVIPFALEILALRRMHPTAFGTLMALEPAIGLVIGLLILHQQPSPTQLVGIVLVVVAGASAQRVGSGEIEDETDSYDKARSEAASKADTSLKGHGEPGRETDICGENYETSTGKADTDKSTSTTPLTTP